MAEIAASSRYTAYSPVVATTNFPVGFPIFDNTDVVVLHNGVSISFSVTATYVDGISENAVCVVSPGITGLVEVVGRRAPRRTAQYINGAPLPIRDHNLALNRIAAENQEARRDVNRAWMSPYGVTGRTITFGAGGDLATFDADGNLVPGALNASDLASVIANLPEILGAQGYAQLAAEKAGEATATVAGVAAEKAIISGWKTQIEGWKNEVEDDRGDVQDDKVTTGLLADAAAQSASDAASAVDLLYQYGDFNQRYLGEHASEPATWNEDSPLDPGSDALIRGLIYWDTVDDEFKTYTGSVWSSGAGNTSDFARKSLNGSDYTAATFRTNLDLYSTTETLGLPAGRGADTSLSDTDHVQTIVGGVWRKLTWANVKSLLKTYFDTLYAAAIHSHTVSQLSDASANGRSLMAATYADMRTLLGLVIGTDVQAYDAQLSSLVRQNSKSAAYTLILSDGGKHIYHPAADTTARIWTIPANSSVAFPIGTVVTFDNDIGAGAITIAITTDTLVLVGAGTTGSRTLAAGGQATAIKVTSTRWRISGVGLT